MTKRNVQLYHRNFYPISMDGCKLYLPFWRYGAQAQKIWDQSGQGNHGTITGAVPYPGNPQATSIGSTFNRGDFTTTNAFFWSSLDLSPYAGTDLGSTPYYIEVLDGAGKKATGYLAGVGAGETLGNELYVTWPYGSNYDTFIYSGKDITSAICLTPSEVADTNLFATVLNELYKYVQNITLNSGDAPRWKAYYGDNSTVGIVQLGAGLNNNYYTEKIGGPYGQGEIQSIVANNFSSVNSEKRVIDPPSTAVHIVSSFNGMTRDWASIESGFDPNNIASWRINRIRSSSCVGWYFDDVNDLIAHPSINFGKTHTLLYWIRSFNNVKGIIHGGSTNYHVAIDGTNLYYNAGATELSQAHGGGTASPTMIGIIRSGTTVQFFKNGIQVGTDQTLDANNDLTLTTVGSYGTPGTFFGGVILENEVLNRALSVSEIKSYYENIRHIYGA